MRLTYKFLSEYFNEYIKPIAPNLYLDTIDSGYCVKLRHEGRSGYKMIVFKYSAKEMFAWLKGFLDCYNYMRDEL
jgi:hypothetical protein